MVTCKICNKGFKKVTNSHLRDKHGIDREEYLRLFPGSLLTSKATVEAISKSSKGKSYTERYGEEVATRLINSRKDSANKQFENVEQRLSRRDKRWTGYKDIAGYTWKRIQNGASKRKLEFSITIEEAWDIYISQKGICALSGFPILLDASLGSLNRNGYQRSTASLDRIDSNKGYTLDNIQWVHKDLNRLKSNWPEDYFFKMCEAVTLFQENKLKINK